MISSTLPRVNLAATAARLADQTSLWQPVVRFDPDARYYARLAAEPSYEAWLLTWLPGQHTDWHDHGGSAGAFVTLRGTLTEQHAVVRPDAPPEVVPGVRELSAGALRTFGRRHLHRVSNHAPEPAVSLHVYAPALVEMNAYVPAGRYLEQVESRLVGVAW